MIRTGIGYDSHRFAEGRRFVLGGVEIPSDVGLLGHSDADALIHALIDALLGAVAAGDIGQHFPDSDPTWKDADSRKLLATVVSELEAGRWRVVNVDATVVAERPKLAPFIVRMRESLATILHVEVSRVSVKAKTNEGMDAVGHREGLAVWAVATVESPPEGNAPQDF